MGNAYYYLINDDLTFVSTTDTKGKHYKYQGHQACINVNTEGTYPNGNINTLNIFQNIICYRNIQDNIECISSVNKISMKEVYCLMKMQDSSLYIRNGNCNKIDNSNSSCRQEIANIEYYIPYYSNQLIFCNWSYKFNYVSNLISGSYKSDVLIEPLIQCIESLNKKIWHYSKKKGWILF